jgi:uncharacterized protein (DUF58 family)
MARLPSPSKSPPGKPRYLDPLVLQKLGPLDLVARQVVEGVRVGMHKSPLRGFSTEFAQHRQYSPGDELKHIDWRVYGRTSRYFVKLYEAETNFTAHLLLDASQSMRFASTSVSKLEYAKFLAASMAYMIVDQRDAAGLGVFDDQVRSYIEPKSTFSVITRIERELEKVKGEPRTNVAAILHEFANRIPRRGFVILFSDLLDDADAYLEGINHLRFRGHNVVVFHVLDTAELTFPYGGTVRFEGLENDGDLLTQPLRVRNAYLEALEAFLRKVRLACERAGVDYVLADTSQPVDAVLTGYLAARQVGTRR